MEPPDRRTRTRYPALLRTALLWAVVVFGASKAHAQAQPGDAATTMSSQGAPGLIAIPSASVVPVGTARIGLNTWPNVHAFGRRGDFRQWNFHFALGLASRLVVGGRGTEVRADSDDRRLARDLSANVHLLLVRESGWWPGIAVGVHDVGGAAVHLRGRYAVATKSLLPWARITAGYGIGPDILDGFFGGVELAPLPHLRLLADYDANRTSAGVRVLPVPERLTAAGYPGLAADLVWSHDVGLTWGITLSSPIDPVRMISDRRDARRPAEAAIAGTSPTISGSTRTARTASERIQDELVDLGLENVRVSCSRECGRTHVVFENRRYNRDEFDALRRAFGVLARQVSSKTDTVSVTLLNAGLPVLEVSIPREDLAVMADRALPSAMRPSDGLRFDAPRLGAASEEQPSATRVANRSRGKIDVVVAPGVETVLYSEIGLAMARVYALPEARVHVLPGTVLSVGATLPITESPDFPGFMPETHIHRALAHVALPLPRPLPGMRGITQFSAGRFSEYFYGWLNDTVVIGWGGRLLVGAKAGIQRFSLSKTDRLFAVGRIRFLFPRADARLTLKAGQFFDRDRGFAIDAARFFGDTEIGLFLRRTDAGALAGIRIAVPLSPLKDMRAYPVRIRPASVWHYEQRTLVFEDRNQLITDIAREVQSGFAVQDVYFNRDRLGEDYFLNYFSR